MLAATYINMDWNKLEALKILQFHSPPFPTFCSKVPSSIKTISPPNAATTSEQVFWAWAWVVIISLFLGRHEKKCVFIMERAQGTAKRGFYPNWDQWTTEFIWVFIGILVRGYTADYRRHTGSFSSTWQERQLMKNTSLKLPEQIIEVSTVQSPSAVPLNFYWILIACGQVS